MRHVGLIPRKRLRHIPYDLRVVHEYCFFLHDECVRILKEYENAEAHLVTVQFPSKLASDEFQKLASTDPIEALRAAGHPNEAKRVILNQITMREAHPAVPGWSICSMRVPCAGDQRRAEGTWDG
jgi:hypothetical protein